MANHWLSCHNLSIRWRSEHVRSRACFCSAITKQQLNVNVCEIKSFSSWELVLLRLACKPFPAFQCLGQERKWHLWPLPCPKSEPVVLGMRRTRFRNFQRKRGFFRVWNLSGGLLEKSLAESVSSCPRRGGWTRWSVKALPSPVFSICIRWLLSTTRLLPQPVQI